MKHIVIIGNGVSGITAARHIRKLGSDKITVVSSETPHFFSRTALMYVYMGHLTFDNTKPYEDRFWIKNRIDLIYDHVCGLNTEQKTIQLTSGKRVSYNILILATGSRSHFPGIPGETLDGVQALYSYPDLQRMEANTRGIKTAIIIGGGLIGVEMAEMLRSRNINVTMLVREQAFWNNVLPTQEANMISRHIMSHGVKIRHEEEASEIVGGANGRVTGVRTRNGEVTDCDFAAIAIGVRPNIGWLKDSGIRVERGILVNRYLETNIPDVYAIGDCVERTYTLEGRKNIEQVWYTARMMGEVVAQTVCGNKTPYEPGPWFNSAKFFDIEFQSYGIVPNIPAAHEADFYWEHHSGRKAVHITWDKSTQMFLGINAFGIRLRHEYFDRWLRSQTPVDLVIDQLAHANFDPEFSDRHEDEIQQHFMAGRIEKSQPDSAVRKKVP